MENTFYFSTPTIEIGKIEFVLRNKGLNKKSPEPKDNWAFIDMQNLYKGVQERGWKIQWESFRQYLLKEHNVTRALVFMGYIEENTSLYRRLWEAGFNTQFREVRKLEDGSIDGGNIDVDLG